MPGDRVALIAENRPEWLIADMVIMAAGAITVPSYTTYTAEDHLHVLTDSGARAVIVSTADLRERVVPAALRSPATRVVIAMEGGSGSLDDETRIVGWDEVMAAGTAREE